MLCSFHQMRGGPPANAYVSAPDPKIYFEDAPMSTTSPAELTYDVFVSDGPTAAGGELMPDGTLQKWSPLSSTLVLGAQDALLVDPPFTRTQIQSVGDWVERSGKRLVRIFASPQLGTHLYRTGEVGTR